jgi:DNA-binding transcriptional LysR family regulator
MRGSDFVELRAFATIVEHGSFSRAARQLHISPSALSQTIRSLEERLGLRLLNRTTRSVAPTEAGLRLLSRLAPALTELDGAVADLTALRENPSGVLRLTVPRSAGYRFVKPILGRFHQAYPEILLDIVIDDRNVDIVAGGFDAGIRLGEGLEKDMIAVRIGGMVRLVAVASPSYIARHGRPLKPRELNQHRCINWRKADDQTAYDWEFEKGDEIIVLPVKGPLIVNDRHLALQGAIEGVGIAYLFEDITQPMVDAGKLIRLLEDWSPPFPGFFLYHPSQRQTPPALRAFIDFMKTAYPA